MLCRNACRICFVHIEGALAYAIRPSLRITPTVKHGCDENALCLHRVQHKVRETPEQRFACLQRDKLVPLGKSPQALHRSVKREQKLETETASLRFVPPKRVLQFWLGLGQEVYWAPHRPPSNLRLISSHDEYSRGSISCARSRRSASSRCAGVI